MSADLKQALNGYMDARGGGDGLFTTAIDGFFLMRSSTLSMPKPAIYRPALCIIVDGAKQLMFGDRFFDYEAMQALIISVEMPAFGRVTKASAERPMIAINLELDVTILREVLKEMDASPRPAGDGGPGVFVQEFGAELQDCILRLIRTLATPKAIPILHPAIMREISFWLLSGKNGDEVCKLALPDSHTRRVAEAIYLLRGNFADAVRVEKLAAAAKMSPSSFHQHFKMLTSMTPLQYQKQLRLLEARRLMVTDGFNAANAAYQVGYESASQFSREYARMFGTPPKRDISEIKAMPAEPVIS
ncbi:AraC family transcriptional regulator [Rhizobium laguerreae]|uniref:AraC family transcriptional regulator n=1 Tax=Rhizobium laguerreae TaxID=1076926 RepID=UPI001441FDFE|nr:AraC family transcriptional regulator [Rhizobium laguerreae]MBY3447785.1 AraC family transcriptional regulator [Rhizobium laguerreae]NKN16126.1 helix-turn-helix domain-containing protein [Rhizobium laguerreae]